jgi:magnesium chelatase family protein
MSSKIFSAAHLGLEAALVEVEADTGGGELGSFSVVGLPDLAVQESRERVRSAIKNSDLNFPKIKVTVNLAPADLKKHGPSYDLPIAVSILVATGILRENNWAADSIFLGELALGGELRPINGVLSIALAASRWGIKTIYLPKENAREAKLNDALTIIPVGSLKELIKHLEGVDSIAPLKPAAIDLSNPEADFDMSQIQGQEQVKRAMEIAAAGGHNMLMVGPPGSGKTMIARTLPSILPDLLLQEALELTKIYSVAGELVAGQSLITSRPFRSPHHTASGVALVGGGTWPRPGEISLAHRGVLFLDEFAEFSRQTLENLRQPLEDGIIQVSRASGSLTFPAKFILVAAMNPCPCGYASDPDRTCLCSSGQIVGYKKKVSGPILDRIDLHIEVPRLKFEKLTASNAGETSAEIKRRIEYSRKIQAARYNDDRILTNSEMSNTLVKKHCQLDNESATLLKHAVNQLQLSARSYFRMLKLARTIADLANNERIELKHLAEALQYRPKAE